MSLPWLSDGVKPTSRSTSNSPSGQQQPSRVDQFGRNISSRSRSRSKSRDKDRDRDRRSEADHGGRQISRERDNYRNQRGGAPYRERGRREDRDRRRTKRRTGSESSTSSSDHSSEKLVRLVAREEPKYLSARVFVANIISKEVTKEELVKHFEKYGNVVDLLVHPKNYAFIQYLKEDHAKLAVEGEHGSTLKGWRLDVKMANEGRRGAGGGRGRGRGRGGPFEGGRGGGRDRSPLREDPYGDPYRSGPGGPRRPPPPFPGDFGMRDPYYPPDPYRRGFPDPWLPPEDPYRRDPYADPYRDPFPAARAPPPPIECEIFLVSSQLRAYGEAIEDRVKDLNIITAVTVMPEGRTASQMLEDLSQRDGLFAVFVNAQNETHRSLTLNILHGTPQEHRNMPLNDAITLIRRSFEQYVETLRVKASGAAGTSSTKGASAITSGAGAAPRVFLPPTQEVTYLLNLLADNRALTVDELNQVIKYLEERRNKLIDAESRPLATHEATLNRSSAQEKPQMPSTEEIKSKILSIFTSAAGTMQGVPPANGSSQPQPANKMTPAPPPPPPPPPASTASSSASLINFDNPNVQKALDNLIQSSPALLKNFNTKASMSEAHMGGTPTNVSSSGSYSYGASQGGMSSSANHQMLGGGVGGSSMMMQGMMGQQEMGGFNMPSRGAYGQTGSQAPQQHHQRY
ncbi:nuclear receptor coactivator 5 [Plakobranchus ocellatus]|uniref:Nuclear receptor coactivator 5 n=1 Tax=Plakobranchus ocellatus TaxID=259542 RepID=A0AAV3ZAV9_9GAST|nr:nuclear receptor coactivator 5 [Plakobranchus ocellatus]